MKKSVILFTALAASMIPFSAFSVSAAEETANIHIKITLDETVLDKDITVKDTNNDGKLTVEDALYTAHEQFYPGGAAAGYSDELIWGKPCSGGYSLINPDEYPLEERPYNDRVEIRDGDVFDWSMHCYNTDSYALYTEFNGTSCIEEPVAQGTKIIFNAVHHTHTEAGTEKVEGVEILINGQKTGIKTDKNGEAEISLDTVGTYTITADLSQFETVFNNKFTYKVVPADTITYTHIIIEPVKDEYPAVNCDLTVSDFDGDGRLTTDDALRLAHRYYGEPDAEKTKLGQNMIWGQSGKFICEVFDGEKLIWSGSAVEKNSESYELKEAGCTVRFRVKDEETKPAQTKAAETASTAAQTEAAKTVSTAAQTETAKTVSTAAQTEAATAANITAAVQNNVTKLPANAPANAAPASVITSDNVKTTGAKTGDDMPVAALAFAGLAAAGGGIAVFRKKF